MRQIILVLEPFPGRSRPTPWSLYHPSRANCFCRSVHAAFSTGAVLSARHWSVRRPSPRHTGTTYADGHFQAHDRLQVRMCRVVPALLCLLLCFVVLPSRTFIARNDAEVVRVFADHHEPRAVKAFTRCVDLPGTLLSGRRSRSRSDSASMASPAGVPTATTSTGSPTTRCTSCWLGGTL